MSVRPSRYRTPEPARVEQRQAPRHRVGVVRATVRKIKAAPGDATLYDISAFGCRLAFAGKHDKGEHLWLRFAGSMPVAATVVWTRDGFLGCRFETPITNDLMRTLIRPVESPAASPAG